MYKVDKELYGEFLNGNEDAFRQIILKHKNNLIYFITKYVKNIDIAEDLSQDVFVYILMNKNKYNPQYSLKTYLYTIAKSRAINYIKREKKIIKIEEYENLYVEDNELEELVLRDEIQKDVRQAINKMKQDYQIVIYLVDFERLSYKEVAKIMNKTTSQIKTLVYNARMRLKEILKKEGISYER